MGQGGQKPKCFNTQPPEGGWVEAIRASGYEVTGFNTQPPEGGWAFVRHS